MQVYIPQLNWKELVIVLEYNCIALKQISENGKL